MLKHQLIHPEISQVLARAGHHAKILIADGNYPAWNKRGPKAQLVSLNLCPGVVAAPDVLRTLLSAVVIDRVQTMGIPPGDPYASAGEPPIWGTYRTILNEAGFALPLEPVLKWDFYAAVESADHVLTIQTGETALWANLLLTMGCRQS